MTLAKLHLILQQAMGWTNSHLHEYEIARQRYGLPDDEDDWPGAKPLTDERRVRLKPPIICLAGANACPPEDVGGYPGYAEFLAVLADPIHEEHAHMLSWAGGAFDLAEVNRNLATIKP